MSFPTVVLADKTVVHSSGSVTSWSGTGPANLAIGDLILLLVGCRNGAMGGLTLPSGFAGVGVVSGGGSSSTIAWKASDGTESGTTLSMSSSNAGFFVTVGYRITGARLEAPQVATTSTRTNTPVALSPSYGAADVLWGAFAVGSHGESISGYPSGFGIEQVQDARGGPDDIRVARAWKQENTATQTPGVFTANDSYNQIWTVALRDPVAIGRSFGGGIIG